MTTTRETRGSSAKVWHAGLTALTALTALAALAALAASPAQAAEEHVLDPVLSLTGSAVTSSEDEVPDPGPNHPITRFETPCGAATDRHGDIYVSSLTEGGRLDVFNPQGEFSVRIEDDHPCGAAVDSEGNVYTGGIEELEVDLLHPSTYPPTASTTYSLTKAFPSFATLGCPSTAVTVDPSNDHFYWSGTCRALEYGSAAEGSPLIGEFQIPTGEVSGGTSFLSGLDVYGKNHDIYATVRMQTPGGQPLPWRIYVFDGGDGHVKCEILGAEAPGDLDFGLGASVAVDQSNGDLYVYDVDAAQGTVYQFAVHGEEECGFIGSFPEPPALKESDPRGDIAVDAPLEAGEEGYDSPNESHVYVTAGKIVGNSHLWAFKPKVSGPPEIESQEAIEIGETEAVLKANLNPNALETKYHFEYTTQADFEANGYANADSVPAPDAIAGEGGAFIPVSEPIAGLLPGTAYRFRLVATNCEAPEAEPGDCLTLGVGKPGEEGEDASFSTYPAPPDPGPCPNEALRSGPSAGLPDCRAYELVTPSDTNGRIPTMAMIGVGYGKIGFDTALASTDGASLVFGTNSGSLPGIGGGGYFDTFEALRVEQEGWQSHFTGLSGAQAAAPYPGGVSPDHLYSFWGVESTRGSLVVPGLTRADYLRVPRAAIEPSPNCAVEAEPDGQFEWIGCGSLGNEPVAAGRWISEGGGHVIFDTGTATGNPASPVRMEPCAPPAGIIVIYDRAPGGPTHCVSVPPAGTTPETKANFESTDAIYKGTSADGTTVVFEVAGTLYARIDNTETVEVVDGKTAFGGVSRDGTRVFYLREPTEAAVPRGELFACDIRSGPCAGPEKTHDPIQIGSGGESVLVNVSADGSHVYFSSPKQLDGEAGEEGKDNLYVWDGEAVRFIAVLDPLDLDQGLGSWVREAVAAEGLGLGAALSRSTPDGEVLLFESHADLTGFESGGHLQLFRYDAEVGPGQRLLCLSCNPTGVVPASDAQLQSSNPLEGGFAQALPPVNSRALIASVAADGERAFFQSAERLVPADLDGKLDVYEWEAEGVGGCGREAGCLSLISSGRGAEDNYLYAMTPDGHDVFFLGDGTLAPQDSDPAFSIYDARVNGGFPPPAPPNDPCLGEACQSTAVAPDDPTPASAGFQGSGNPPLHRRPCRKGERRVRSKGKTRCVKSRGKKHPHRKNHRANTNRGAGR